MCSSSLQKRHGMEPREIQNTAHNTVRHDRMARGIPEDRQGRILRFWERHNKTILPPSQWKSHHYGAPSLFGVQHCTGSIHHVTERDVCVFRDRAGSLCFLTQNMTSLGQWLGHLCSLNCTVCHFPVTSWTMLLNCCCKFDIL